MIKGFLCVFICGPGAVVTLVENFTRVKLFQTSKDSLRHGIPQEVEYQVRIHTSATFSPAIARQWMLLIPDDPC